MAAEVAECAKNDITKRIIELYPKWINVPSNDTSNITPLHNASRVGRIDNVRILLQYGADVNIKDSKGRTALVYAAYYGHIKIVIKTIQFGAQLDSVLEYAKGDGAGKDGQNNKSVIDFLSLLTAIIESRASEKEIDDYLDTYFKGVLNREQQDLFLNVVICILTRPHKSEKTILSYFVKNKKDYLYQVYKRCHTFRDIERNTLLHLLVKERAIGLVKFLTLISEHNNSKKPDVVGSDPEVKSLIEGLSSISLQQNEEEGIYLFLGGGDLSFELSFAKKHSALAKYMVVTTYESETEFKSRNYYLQASKNLSELVKLGAKTFHGVDAQRLHEWDFLKDKQLIRIYFSHPYAGKGIGGHDTRPVLRNFFASVTHIKWPPARILVARRKNNGDGHSNNHYKGVYGFYHTCNEGWFNYRLVKKHHFTTTRYPGYSHVTTGATAKSPFKDGSSLEYVFEKTNNHLAYYSDLEEDSDSDTEVSDLEPHSYLENRNKHGQTLLHLAVQQERVILVRKLLRLGAIANTIDSIGKSCLFYAIEINSPLAVEMAKVLIDFEVQLDYVSPVSGLGTPFEYLLQRLFSDKNNPVFKELMKLFVRSNPDIVDRYKHNPQNPVLLHPYNQLLFDICIDVIKDSKTETSLSEKPDIHLISATHDIKKFELVVQKGKEIVIEKADNKFKILYKKKDGKIYNFFIDEKLKESLKFLSDLSFDGNILNRDKNVKVYELIYKTLKGSVGSSNKKSQSDGIIRGILDVSRSGNNCGLFALSLGIKVALANKPQCITRVPNFVIKAIKEDFQQETQENKDIGKKLRGEIYQALSKDGSLKRARHADFVTLAVAYLREQQPDPDMEAFLKSNKTFLESLKKKWEEIKVLLSKKKIDGDFQSHFEKQLDKKIIIEHVVKLKNLLKTVTESDIEKKASEFITGLLQENPIMIDFVKVFQLIWDEITQNDAPENIRRRFRSVVYKFFDGQLIKNLINKNGQEQIDEIFKMAFLRRITFKPDGKIVKIPELKDVIEEAASIFCTLNVNDEKWQEIYENYLQHVRDTDVFISADELGCLASFWDVQLKVKFLAELDPFKSYDVKHAEKLQVTLCNPSRLHWNVQCDDELPSGLSRKISEFDKMVIPLIMKIKNIEWQETIIGAINNKRAYVRKEEDCSQNAHAKRGA